MLNIKQNTKLSVSTLLLCLVAGFVLVALGFGHYPYHINHARAASTYTVDSIGDEPDDNPGDLACHTALDTCTLRAAIQEVNAGAGGDTINFGISGTGVHTLTPASCYDAITKSVTIDGYSQPGSAVNTAVAPAALNGTLTIELDGTNLIVGCYGLSIDASNVNIRGLSIHNFTNNGVFLNASNSSILGNYITNNPLGIELSSLADNANIGSTSAADRNLISGNNSGGVSLLSGNSDSIIRGNYIGVAVDGVTGQGNFLGIDVCSNSTIIGGTDAGAINVVAGNGDAGVKLCGTSVGAVIQGNYIGLDSTGVTVLGNGGFGIGITGAQDNIIGGTTLAARNLIAGNNFNQIILFNTSGNVLQGNYIGTDKNGAPVINPTITNGISIANDSTNNLIGGVATGAGNKIAHNTASGVVVINIAGFGADPLNNSVIGNDIEQNTTSGIRLCNDTNTDFACDTPEPYPNDVGDPDVGPNMFMNFPVINSATKGSGQVTVNYDLDINPAEVGATGYSVDFYANSTNDREGAIYLGSDTVLGDVSGQSATLTLPGSVPADYYVTAVTTMTDASSDGYGHSSEFSAPVQAIAAGPTPGPTPTPSPSGNTDSSSLANTGQAQHNNQRLFVALALIALGTIGIAGQRIYRKNKTKSL